MTSVLWFRRDPRLRDHPALHEAAAKDGPVVALFVLDPALLKPAGAPRVASLYRSLRALDAELREHGGALLVRRGDPVNAVPKLVREAKVASVRHFMRHLVDGDLASNEHGWQWTVGTGTDAAPLYRVFNPALQGKKFDPDDAYVRRWSATRPPAPRDHLAIAVESGRDR